MLVVLAEAVAVEAVVVIRGSGGGGGKARNNFRRAFRHDDRPNSF